MPAMRQQDFLAFLNALQPSPAVTPAAVLDAYAQANPLPPHVLEALRPAVPATNLPPFEFETVNQPALLPEEEDQVVAQLLQEQATPVAPQGFDRQSLGTGLLELGSIIAGLSGDPAIVAPLQAQLDRQMREEMLGRREAQANQLLGLRQREADQKLEAAQRKLARDEEKRETDFALAVARLAEQFGDVDTAERVLRTTRLGEGFGFNREAIAAEETRRQEEEDREFITRALVTTAINKAGFVPDIAEGILSEDDLIRWAAGMLSDREKKEAAERAQRERDKARHERRLIEIEAGKKKGGSGGMLKNLTEDQILAGLAERSGG